MKNIKTNLETKIRQPESFHREKCCIILGKQQENKKVISRKISNVVRLLIVIHGLQWTLATVALPDFHKLVSVLIAII